MYSLRVLGMTLKTAQGETDQCIPSKTGTKVEKAHLQMVSCACVMLHVWLLHIVLISYEPSSCCITSVKSPASMYPEGLWW